MQSRSRFYSDFVSFANDNNLITTDLNRIQDGITYVSDDGSKVSWVDHIFSSAAIDSLISNISILNDVIASNHKPISFDIAGININHTEISVTVDSDVCSVPMWSNCGDKTLAYYTSYVDHLLQYNHSL